MATRRTSSTRHLMVSRWSSSRQAFHARRMTRDDLFNINASIVHDLASAIGRVSPKAHILVISNPVNSTVPIVASTLLKTGVNDLKHIFGVTTLDVVCAVRFTVSLASTHPDNTPITVDGGHSGATMVHPLSQSAHGKGIEREAYEKLVHCIQFGEDKVVKAKHGAGSATLSMAYAGAKFVNAVLRVLNSEKGVITPMFVESPLFNVQGPWHQPPLVQRPTWCQRCPEDFPAGRIVGRAEASGSLFA
ncbi:hypothetical protein SCLCIDRAFT_1164344 [Scleroderma citrinum Foug A]|uniref:malate dehydrogenase n=1 Tax=Scleroderma citrinum Foug A TaxID=1036808 RepID=A0A0C2YR99_9AGAM|nr:hypothetical protein SCLCIDRAFT_1164344 [Scleroderma citrinum Foug A]